MKEQLRGAGLTENEAKMYLSLLENGPSNAGLISRKAGMHRRVVYDTAYMLIKKGLVGYILRNNTRIFQAVNPSRLREIIEEKEKAVEEILPDMLAIYGKTREREETNFYKGKNGLKTVFEEQLSEASEILILGANPLAYEMLQFYFHWFDKKRIKKKLKAKIIFTRRNFMQKIPYAEIRFLPQKYSSPLAVNIYGEKVALVLWSKTNPFAVVIKNREMSEGYKKYFELMWKTAKK